MARAGAQANAGGMLGDVVLVFFCCYLAQRKRVIYPVILPELTSA